MTDSHNHPWWSSVGIALVALLVVAVLMRASQNMAQTSFPLVAADLLHLPSAAVGIIAAAGAVVSLLTMVMVASRVRRNQIARVLVGALVLMCISLLLISASHSVSELVAGVLLLGAGGGVLGPTLLTAVGSLDAQDPETAVRDRPIALIGVSLSVGLVLGPFVEMGVLEAGGGSLRNAFAWFALGPLGAAALLAIVFMGRAQWQRPNKGTDTTERRGGLPQSRCALSTPGNAPSRVVAGEDVATGAQGSSRARLSFRQALEDPSFQVALLGQLLYAAPFSALIVFGALFERSGYQMEAAQIQGTFGVFFLTSLAVRIGLVSRVNIPNKLAWFRVAALITMAGLVVMALGHGQFELLLAMALLGIPHGLTFPLAMALVAEGRSHDELAAVNAHLYAGIQGVNVALPPLLGLVISVVGFRATFMFLLVPVVVCGVSLHRLGAQMGLVFHQGT